MAQPRRRGEREPAQERPATGKKVDPRAEAKGKKPPPGDVADFHSNSDVDARREAQHHTLGVGANQASPGAHTHNGDDPDSLPLWRGVNLTDPSATSTAAEMAAAIANLNALIRAKSG